MDPIKNIDDPRLTAYALGELEGDAAAAVERFLEQNDEARAAVGEIRALGAVLGEDLLSDAAGDGGLDEDRRAAIRTLAAGGAPAVSPLTQAEARPRPTLLSHPLLRIAALLIVGVGFSYWFLPYITSTEPTESDPHGSLNRRGWVAGNMPVGERDKSVEKALGALGYGLGGSTQRASSSQEVSEEELVQLRALGYSGGPTNRNGGTSSDQPVGEQLVPNFHNLESLGYQDGSKVIGGAQPEVESAVPAQPSASPSPTIVNGTSTGTSKPYLGGGVAEASRSKLGEADSAQPTFLGLGPGAASFGGTQGKLAGRPAVTVAEESIAAGSPGFLTGRGERKRAAGDDALMSRDEYESLAELGYTGGEDLPAYDDYLRANTPADIRRRSSGEGYAQIHHNPFVSVATGQPLTALSTFAVDVDRASYANVRRFLNRNQLPPVDAVRLEELVNAFSYEDAPPSADAAHPFAVHVSSANAPWAPQHRLVRVALKGRVIEQAQRPPVSLTFLCDVSGSMRSDDKLPLLKASLKMLLNELDEGDHVSLVTYASGSKVVLPPTSAGEKQKIISALDGLSAGGSTAGAAGLQLAYQTAESIDFGDGAVRRILLCTDGDFNVGISSQQGLHDFIAEKAKTGVFLTVLGFGTGNYQDTTAETLADRGNGQYAYIDGLDEAHRVLVRQLTGTLVTIAQDVKLQLEFNPAHVAAWRQLGYENRQMAAQDFRNDKKDAGEIGAGHSVVAYYEIVPIGVPVMSGTADLKYQSKPVADADEAVDASPEWLTVNLRYKQPGAKPSDEATEFNTPFTDAGTLFAQASDDFRFGSSVIAFGMALRQSPHKGRLPLSSAVEIARRSRGADPHGDRAEFVNLALRAVGLLPDESQTDTLRELGYLGDDAR